MLSRMNARSSVPQGAGLAATASAACDHCHIEGIVLLFLYQVVEATLSHSFFGRRMEAVPVLKLLALVIALIIAAMVAGAYLHFNPAIPIFIILGFGIYRVGRIGGPQFPEGTHVSFGDAFTCMARTSCHPIATPIAAATFAMVSIRTNESALIDLKPRADHCARKCSTSCRA
jgi:hypothetical protein